MVLAKGRPEAALLATGEFPQLAGRRGRQAAGLALLWQNCFMRPVDADPFSAVGTLAKRLDDAGDDGVADGWEGWLRW